MGRSITRVTGIGLAVLAAIVCGTPASATSDNAAASAVVVGSCNIVQQNVKVPENSVNINEVDCVPVLPENSFRLRYVWLDAATTSFIVNDVYPSGIKRIVGQNPSIMKNEIFDRVAEIVRRFGVPKNAETMNTANEPAFTLEGNGERSGSLPVTKADSAAVKASRTLKMYDGQDAVPWPDVDALMAVVKTKSWPTNYNMVYDEIYPPSADDGPPSKADVDNAMLACVGLYRGMTKQDVQGFGQSLSALRAAITHGELSYATSGLAKSDLAAKALKNNVVEALLYFGRENWPGDFAMAKLTTSFGCGSEIAMGVSLQPRHLVLLAAVLQPKSKDLEISGMSFMKDASEGLRPKAVQAQRTDAPEGVVSLGRDESLIIPLRIELRYDKADYAILRQDSDPGRTARGSFDKIKASPASELAFRGVPDGEQAPGGATSKLPIVFRKDKAAFRPPEWMAVNTAYITGPSLELSTLTIGGKTISVRSAPASALSYLGETGMGSCPFLFAADGTREDPVLLGRVLVGASSKQAARTDTVALDGSVQSVVIAEREPEVTVLSRVAVVDATTHVESVLATDLVLRPGEARALALPPAPGGRTLVVTGYYRLASALLAAQ